MIPALRLLAQSVLLSYSKHYKMREQNLRFLSRYTYPLPTRIDSLPARGFTDIHSKTIDDIRIEITPDNM